PKPVITAFRGSTCPVLTTRVAPSSRDSAGSGQPLHLRRHTAGVRGGVEGGDVVDAGLAGDQVLPEGVLADAEGGDDPEARDDDPTGGLLHAPARSCSTRGELFLKWERFRESLGYQEIKGNPNSDALP